MTFPSLQQISTQSKGVFKRFPFSILSTLISMFLIIYLIEVNGPENENFLRLIKVVFIASLGVFMFTALRLLGDKNLLFLLGILGFFIMMFWENYWRSSPSNEQF